MFGSQWATTDNNTAPNHKYSTSNTGTNDTIANSSSYSAAAITATDYPACAPGCHQSNAACIAATNPDLII
jgi:hypothetical protein